MPRRTVITGSASGIGRALADQLRERGEEVVGVDLRDAEVLADLATAAGRAAAVAAVKQLTEGRVDALVTCAGVAEPSPLMVRINYFGTVEVAEGLRPLLAGSPAPRVAVLGSISGTMRNDERTRLACLEGDEEAAVARAVELTDGGRPHSIYPSTKAALAEWARRTAISPGWADAGIALNVVAPGVVLTPMTTGLFEDDAMREVMDAAVPMPLNGYAPPEAIARVLAFLVSEDNTHVTGQVLYVDGGAEVTQRPADLF
ncbi:SDR family oxidoreductase [Nocardioides marmotae]|uniref:SDR family oxidoreductase n=1 Tax=Nocardioides marmotae TaxID=2663857 RepID=A0A6I3JE72_9ACTN|nr:SDR family oxidoreductase [Nocardioides marmotae]MCR6032790.1 SDR family oxidoreductase [Gordonia jinghuaiqii]MBC9735569.1 SDR family oxidoreductase [Nocardioides marmotae]MTB86665.1 SDR family oxidoreductase [Nocardioides marmotae]MTB96440.1 SDR family oxidoreductase [Nocardioides marmotae]QKE02034.1 SDR family oxidoreductase [Nocardioides marmotae]